MTSVPRVPRASSAHFVLCQVKELLATDDFKPNSALVILDFLIRHSLIEPDTGLLTAAAAINKISHVFDT